MNNRRLRINAGLFLLCLVVILALTFSAFCPKPDTVRAAGPWYVAPGGSDSNSFLSPGSPCETTNGTIGKATAGDTINVATGTYTGTGDEVVLIDRDIILSGGWDGSFIQRSGTSIIDAEDEQIGIFVNNNYIDWLYVNIDNFTIQHDDRSGVNCIRCTVTIENSVIKNNSCSGGVCGGEIDTPSLFLVNSTVSNTTSMSNYNPPNISGGGGIYGQKSSTISIIDSKIVSNVALGEMGFTGYGGGILLDEGSCLSMSGGIIIGNHAEYSGGGIYSKGSFEIVNSIHAGNLGGGFSLIGEGSYSIFNSNVIGNQKDGNGADILMSGNDTTITNTLIINNPGDTGINVYESNLTLNYCDTCGNSPDGMESGTISRINCLGSSPDDGLDPLMAGGTLPGGVGPDYADEWLNYDYRLLPGSPAINAGTLSGAPTNDIEGNPSDLNPDLGAYEVGITKDNILYLPLIQRNYCQPLYADDFSDPGSGWYVTDNGVVLAEYTGGEYRMFIYDEDWHFMTRPGFQAADYTVSVDLRNLNNVYGSYGIAFGIASDWSSLYTFEIFPDGSYGIYRWDPQGFAVLVEGYSPAINQGSATNTIKIVRNGASIEAYANGQLLTSVSDGTYTGTRTMGLAVFSYDDPNVDVRFDNFKVYPIDCEQSSSTSFTLNSKFHF